MIGFIVKHRAPVLLLLICTLLFGVSSYQKLPRESNPDVQIPLVMVMTPYVGVSPKDIESLVTIPLENEIAGLSGLKEISSSSSEGMSVVTLEFTPEVIIDDALQKVRDRVSRAQSKLPQDAEDTIVTEISFSDMPIMLVNIAGPVDETILKKLAEDLQDDLERLPGALKVPLSGGRTRAFRVHVDPNRLAHYELGMRDVVDAIKNENVNIPGGEVTAKSANFLVRVPGEFKDISEIEHVAIVRRGDRPVFIRDIAEVSDSFEDRTTYSRMNGEPSVSLGVVKRSGANIVELAEAAKEKTAEHQRTWPAGVNYRVLADQSRDVDLLLSELQNNMILALILVIGVIIFFMGIKNSLFVAIAIPLSMLMAMMVFSLMGVTLNMVVLFSLILVLGMLVDNAIVLVENIYRHLELGLTPLEASIIGAKEIALPVAASTATTVAAFAPLLAWTGIMGQFMVYLPLTLVVVLLSSLVVAIVMLPVVTSLLLTKPALKKKKAQNHGFFLRAYRHLLTWAIEHSLITSFAMLLILVGSFVAYFKLNHGVEFFPETEPDRAIIAISAPDGTDLEETDRIVREVEEILLQDKAIETYVAETGVSAGDVFSGGGGGLASNQAKITLNFFAHASKAISNEIPRIEDSRLTIQRLRDDVQKIVGADIRIEMESQGPPVGKPISLEIASDDFDQAGAFSSLAKRELTKVKGVTGIDDNYRVGRPELRFVVNRGAAKRVGASTGEIASAVRTAVNGTKASAFRDGDDEYDIMVELAPEFKDNLGAILDLRVPGREDMELGTYSIPISSVASYELAGGTGAIQHVGQNPVVTLSADVAEGLNQNEVQAAAIEAIDALKKPPGVKVRLGGANDEQKETEAFLITAFGIAVFLIALVLVAQFNGFSLPIIVLASVVLSLVGVLWGLILTGNPFGIIMTGLGVISLAGVVVNNAIVLLDYVQLLRAEGMARKEALIEAGMTRFRPVMLTATTTILGLVPMAIGLSIDFSTGAIFWGTPTGNWWKPMAVAVVFGLAFATLLTLVVVPTFYVVLDSTNEFLSGLFRKKTTEKLTLSDSTQTTAESLQA